VLGLLVLVVGAAVLRFAQVGEGVAQLTQHDWRSAEAAALLDATTRSNTRRTMELFFVTSPQDEAVLHQKIRENRALVDQALAELDTLLTDPAQRRSLAEIQAARVAYVRSFTQVSALLKDGQRSQAEALLRQETLPAIDALQVPVRALAAQVREQVSREGEALRESLLAERLRVLAGGVAALCVGLGMAIWLARGITRPLGRAVAVAEAVAQGDLSVRVGDRPPTRPAACWARWRA
jgi:methyl-accepting chemotaxis protein